MIAVCSTPTTMSVKSAMHHRSPTKMEARSRILLILASVLRALSGGIWTACAGRAIARPALQARGQIQLHHGLECQRGFDCAFAGFGNRPRFWIGIQQQCHSHRLRHSRQVWLVALGGFTFARLDFPPGVIPIVTIE